MKKISHKKQELNWDFTLMVKDHILKKYFWFYKFKDIFHKYSDINPFLIIESGQPTKCDGTTVDENYLENYDFDLNKNLEDFYQIVTCEIKGEKDISVFFSNFPNLGSDSNSSIYFALSQITRDARQEACKKTNKKILREVESENNNLIILSNNKEENEDIFPIQVYISNSIRPFYFCIKSQQASTNISGDQSLTPSFSTLSKSVVWNRNLSLFFKNHISKRKYHSNSDQLLAYVEDAQGFWAKKRFKNLKLSIIEAMVEETKLNYIYLTEQMKTNKKQVKKDWKEYWKQVEYNCYQRNQYHVIKITC